MLQDDVARGPYAGRMKPWSRRVLTATIMAAVMIGAPLAWYQLSVQPGAALVRAAFESGPSVRGGPGVALERPDVTEHLDIRFESGEADVPPASLDVYAPSGATGLPVVLWIHGGGFIANSAADIGGYARVIADHGYVVAALDYSLAPGHRYPVPVIQANAALGWLTEHAAEYGGDPTRIVIGGDSAGAQLASQTAAIQSDRAFAATVGVVAGAPDGIRGAVLFCGVYDMTTVGDTGFPALRTFLWSYTGHRDWLDAPRIGELSTTRTATSSYPPTLIAVGDDDPFDSQGRELAAALTGKGVAVTSIFWEDEQLGHEYQFDFALPQARETLDRALAFLEETTR